MMRVVVSGGGSGGHIFPALAVAASVKRLRPEAELLYIGGTSGMECQIVPELGIRFQAVTARKLQKILSPSTVSVFLALWRGYREARQYLRDFDAQVIVGTGGYVAAGAVLAGTRLGLPALIVSPDVIPGRTNRVLARNARRICIAFEQTRAHFAADKCVLTGLPLRAGVIAPSATTAAQARVVFQPLQAAPFTIVVIGGSQGAQALNRLVLEAAPKLIGQGAQILHQTGVRNLEHVQQMAQQQGLLGQAGYAPVAFLNETQVPLALRAADVIVCRGGISTLSEAMVNGLPALVVPLPTAYADHQTLNARVLESARAALLRPETTLTAESLTSDLLGLRDDALLRIEMRQAMLRLGRPHAADLVAHEVFKLIDGTR